MLSTANLRINILTEAAATNLLTYCVRKLPTRQQLHGFPGIQQRHTPWCCLTHACVPTQLHLQAALLKLWIVQVDSCTEMCDVSVVRHLIVHSLYFFPFKAQSDPLRIVLVQTQTQQSSSLMLLAS